MHACHSHSAFVAEEFASCPDQESAVAAAAAEAAALVAREQAAPAEISRDTLAHQDWTLHPIRLRGLIPP